MCLQQCSPGWILEWWWQKRLQVPVFYEWSKHSVQGVSLLRRYINVPTPMFSIAVPAVVVAVPDSGTGVLRIV
ncbi:unnamed protein product [Cylicostephanus goldi]|uniref:Uncharacterized protein n=1 Tax=Cylicostephanus goldi TaxID=71465 RepID=A0A3P6RMD0_CYLGO|nr:unnamed protein product [Cylicostephanus goldi]